MPDPQQPTDLAGPAEADVAEASHRAFAREMNRAFSSVYGWGGAAVLLIGGLAVWVGALLGALWSPVTWIVAVTLMLVSLFALRLVLRRRAYALAERIEQYCAANDLSVDRMRAYFAREDVFPFFESIFETIERHKRLTADATDEPRPDTPEAGDS